MKNSTHPAPFLVRPFQIKSIKQDDDNFIIEGFASVYGNVDSYGEIVQVGAFSEDLAKNGNVRPILWMHYSCEPIGKGIFTDSPAGLFVRIELPRDDDFVKGRVMPQVKIGSVKGLSIGYFTLEEVVDKETNIITLIKLKLRETSTVTFPANDQAQIVAAKNYLQQFEKKESEIKYNVEDALLPTLPIDTDWNKSKSVTQIRENTNSIKTPSKQYSKGFLAYDNSKKGSFGGYNFPFTYYVDGKFKAVPVALFKMVGVLIGKNSAKLTPELKEQLKEKINEYYIKMNIEPPFNNGIAHLDRRTLENFDKHDYSKIFEKDVILSHNAKQFVVDKMAQSEKEETQEPSKSTEKSELSNELELLSKTLGV